MKNIQSKFFNFIIFTTYFLYFLVIFGLSTNAPQYLEIFQTFVKIYISLFLIIRFNPFRNILFNELDKKIVFSAGVFLLMTTFVNEIATFYLNKIKNKTQLIIKNQ